MADIVLGARAKSLEVVLTKDADFFTTLTTEDASDWPSGAIIRLTLGAQEFDAVISGPDASISIDSVTVNAIIAARTATVLAKLYYIDGASEICWAVGTVNSSG